MWRVCWQERESQPHFYQTHLLNKAGTQWRGSAPRIILATPSSVTQLLVWRNQPRSPEWSCHRAEWEMSGFQPKRIYMAGCINSQAFPAVPNISGNFLIQRTGRQLCSPTCLLLMSFLYYLNYLKTNCWAKLFHRTMKDLLVKY